MLSSRPARARAKIQALLLFHLNVEWTPIGVGGTQVEVGFSTLTFRLDAQCFGIWAEEMLRSHPASEPHPKPKSAAG
jgi:hypothetical protein